MADERDPMLVCYGCAHSAANEAYPSRPSGERPCCFCTRNAERDKWLAEHLSSDCRGDDCKHPLHGFWYNGKRSSKCPMDNYITSDRVREETVTDPAEFEF